MTCSSRRGETGICVVKYSDSSDITPVYTYVNNTLFLRGIQPIGDIDTESAGETVVTENDDFLTEYG